MDAGLKDYSFGVIQRDRLSEYFKTVDEKQSGCFYFSLINSYHHLNPGKMLPRNFEQTVLTKNPSLDVKGSEFYKRINELRDTLHLEMFEVLIMPGCSEIDESIYQNYGIPRSIPVNKSSEGKIRVRDNEVALIFCVNRKTSEGHTLANVPAKDKWFNYNGAFGGREGLLEVEKAGFRAQLVFFLKKFRA